MAEDGKRKRLGRGLDALLARILLRHWIAL